MENKKMTQTMALVNAIELMGSIVDENGICKYADEIEKLNALKTSIENKRKSKNSKTNEEQAKVDKLVLDAISNCEDAITVTDLIKSTESLTDFSSSKVTASLGRLMKLEVPKVKNEKIKGKSYYSVV